MHWFHPAAVLLLMINLASTARENIIPEILALGLSLRSQLLPASHYTQRWSNYEAPSYIIAVKPATKEDVAKIIGYAANSSIPFLSTGGGHGFATTLGRLTHGIEIDLSNFDSVDIDIKGNTLTIGGSVRFRDVLGPLGQAHKELSIGSESCVGMVGATLGGGVGRYNGLHGMLLDSLLSVKMVTAAGKIITVSTTEHSDLFWGVRGAGFNYGTILEAKYSVYDETVPLVLNADFLFAPNTSRAILEYFKSFEDGLPAELSFILLATYSPEIGGSVILVNAVYAGSQSEGAKYLQPLLAASPVRHNFSMIPWSAINSVSFFGSEPANYTCPTDSTHNVYGSAVYRVDVDAFQAFYENYEHLTSSMSAELGGTVYFIEFFPKQGVEAVPSSATAYPWRNITVHLLLNFAYDAANNRLDRQINDFARSARRNFSAVSGFPQPELYVSYGHGDEALVTLYSAENLPRLRSLKEKWDPNNVYGYNYPITL